MYPVDSTKPYFGTRKNIALKYPFKNMGIGDSFAVGLKENESENEYIRHRVDCAASRWGKILKQKFSVRLVRSDAEVRCWRVE